MGSEVGSTIDQKQKRCHSKNIRAAGSRDRNFKKPQQIVKIMFSDPPPENMVKQLSLGVDQTLSNIWQKWFQPRLGTIKKQLKHLLARRGSGMADLGVEPGVDFGRSGD